MTADRMPSPADVVAAGDVDPVLWDMNTELVSLRRDLAEVRDVLGDRERQLSEVQRGAEGNERAVNTLKSVLTDMVLKGRTELQTAREEATRTIADRLASAQAEADALVADAAAALTTALGRPFQPETAEGTFRTETLSANGPLPSTPRPEDGIPGSPRWPVDAFTPPPPLPPPATGGPWAPAADGDYSSVASPRLASMNGSTSPPGSLLTLDRELDHWFEQVVALPPNTEFRTPPRGNPILTSERLEIEVPTVVVFTAVDEIPPAEALAARQEAEGRGPVVGEPQVARRTRFTLIDVLLPIIALTLVMIVVMSWRG